MEPGKYFLSCDWGTSSFRLRLVDKDSLSIIAEVNNDNGIASTHTLWKQSGFDENERLSFYSKIIAQQILSIEKKVSNSLSGVPLILSGMASSSLGMIELPYKELPFLIDGSDLAVHAIESSGTFAHDIIVVSGVRSDDDVMRGEEIQLVGCFTSAQSGKQLFIMPGTHSKHVTVVDDKVVDFQTFMTGEIFNLLSTKSILSASVEQGASIEIETNKESFIEGVNDSTIINPLHAFFLVRTNALLGKMTKQENLYYLSGLLIGLELKDVSQLDCKTTLVSNNKLQPYYELGIQQLGFKHRLFTIDVDEAMIKGHYQVYYNHFIRRHSSYVATCIK